MNRGDYVTKHHTAIHHQSVRPTFLTAKSTQDNFRRKAALIASCIIHTAKGCAKSGTH